MTLAFLRTLVPLQDDDLPLCLGQSALKLFHGGLQGLVTETSFRLVIVAGSFRLWNATFLCNTTGTCIPFIYRDIIYNINREK